MIDESPSKGIQFFFLALFILTTAGLVWLLSSFLSVLVLGSVLSSVFRPLYVKFNSKAGPAISSLATCSLLFVLLFIPLAFLVSVISKEAYDFYIMAKSAVIDKEIQTIVENSELVAKANQVLSTFDIRLTGEQVKKIVSEFAKQTGLFLYRHASSVASNVFVFFIDAFIMLIIVFFLLIDGDRLVSFFKGVSPLPDDQEERLIAKFKDMAFAILVINGSSGLIQGTMGVLVFSLFGFKTALLWGVISGLAAFLPVIGIPAVFIPVGVYLMLTGRVGDGVFFVVFSLAVSMVVDNVVKPKLLGDRFKIHPLLVFLSIVGGLKLFGPLGIVYGPLIATMFLTLAEIYHSKYRTMVEENSPESHSLKANSAKEQTMYRSVFDDQQWTSGVLSAGYNQENFKLR